MISLDIDARDVITARCRLRFFALIFSYFRCCCRHCRLRFIDLLMPCHDDYSLLSLLLIHAIISLMLMPLYLFYRPYGTPRFTP